MLQKHYLNLQLVRLKPPKEWVNKEPGLSFLFLKGGAAICDSGVNTCQLESGDVLVLNEAGGGKVCASKGQEAVFWSFSLCFEHLFPLFESHEICFLRCLYDVFKEAKRYPASEAVARQCFRLLADLPPPFTLDHRGQLIRIAAGILASEFSRANGLCPWSVKNGQPNQPGGEVPSIPPAKFPSGFTSPPYQGLMAGTA
jgi:hypothetical protein